MISGEIKVIKSLKFENMKKRINKLLARVYFYTILPF